jgi:hypothetical protein
MVGATGQAGEARAERRREEAPVEAELRSTGRGFWVLMAEDGMRFVGKGEVAQFFRGQFEFNGF